MSDQDVERRTHRSAMIVILVLLPIIAALAFIVLRPRTANPPGSATPAAAPAATPPAATTPAAPR